MTKQDLRMQAKKILAAALEAAAPGPAVKKGFFWQDDLLQVGRERLNPADFDKIIVVGAGKAGAAMAAALEEVLGGRLSAGKVVVKDGHLKPTRVIKIFQASHPVPDARGVAAGEEISALLQQYAQPRTLVFCLLSGGGSALLVAPAEGISLADKQAVTGELLACGADISEINAVRKHLSRLKGGQLARLAHPAKVVSLIISDVVGDRLDVIASGPTVPDLSTWADCREILARYQIWDKVPPSVRGRIEKGLAGNLPDTPKPGDASLAEVVNLIVASNRQALDSAAQKARELGFAPLILSSSIEGETKDIARMHAALAQEVRATGHPASAPCCLISGGETTVTLGPEPGQGGRNQEFALAAALDVAGLEDLLVVSAGTDGTDGPTDAAGAQADGRTTARAREKGLNPRDFLRRHDAYQFFRELNDLIITGPTLTNVMDIRLILLA